MIVWPGAQRGASSLFFLCYRSLSLLQLIDFRCKNEVAFGEPVDFMRPGSDFSLSPRQQNIRMVPLLFGNLPYLIDERQRLTKIRKRKFPRDVVTIHHLPLRHLLRKRLKFLACQRRHATSAWNTCLAG